MVDKVVLFGMWASPFSRRVEMGLKLKGIEYELVEEDIKNKSDLLLHYNPVHKKVPVLVHNGNPIAESLVILEYIDQTWPDGPSILPKDPYHRAMARFWAKFVDEKCTAELWKLCWTVGKERDTARAEAIEWLAHLDKEVAGKKFFAGDTIGLVDIAANFFGYWFEILAQNVDLHILDKDKFPNLRRWIDSYNNDSFVQENLPSKERLTAVFKGMVAEAAKQAPTA